MPALGIASWHHDLDRIIVIGAAVVAGLAAALLGYGLTVGYAKLLGKLANRISGAELPVEPE